MSFEIIPRRQAELFTVPAIIADASDHAARRFLRWCEHRRLGLRDIEPIAIAAYFHGSDPTKKQHLAAVSSCA